MMNYVTMFVLILFFNGCRNDSNGGHLDESSNHRDQKITSEDTLPIPQDWDLPPQLVHSPTVPENSFDKEGNVFLWIVVNQEGTVDSAWIEKSSTYAKLDSIALDLALRTTFTPAIKDERPVVSRVLLPFQFRSPTNQTIYSDD